LKLNLFIRANGGRVFYFKRINWTVFYLFAVSLGGHKFIPHKSLKAGLVFKTKMAHFEGIEVRLKSTGGNEESLKDVVRIECDNKNIHFVKHVIPKIPNSLRAILGWLIPSRRVSISRQGVDEFEAKISEQTNGMFVRGTFENLGRQRLRNVTEVHYNYPSYGWPYRDRVAFESDIHQTGVTYPVGEFEVRLEKRRAKYF
jgi:hypothetical protein